MVTQQQHDDGASTVITQHDGKFHIRLSANDRADVVQAMTDTGIEATFFAVSGADLLVVLGAMEDAMFLTMMFCLRV